MSSVEIESKVDGLGTIYSLDGYQFDVKLRKVLDKCDELISSRDFAFARMKDKNYRSLTKNDSFVSEGSLSDPKFKRTYLLRKSLVLQNPIDALKAHSTIDKNGLNNEYFLPQDFNVDEYIEKINKNDYFISGERDCSISSKNYRIPSNRFGEDARTVWLFQDQAKEYGEFLVDYDCKDIFIDQYTDLLNNRRRPFAGQLMQSRPNNETYHFYNTVHNSNLTRKDIIVHGILYDEEYKKSSIKKKNNFSNPWDLEIPTIENKVMSK